MEKRFKVFISQPMKGKTPDEIKKEKERLIRIAADKFSEDEDYEIIDSYFENTLKSKDNVVYDRVWYLGRSLIKLSEADYAVFGTDWVHYDGCCIEHEVCKRYGIKIIYD